MKKLICKIFGHKLYQTGSFSRKTAEISTIVEICGRCEEQKTIKLT